MKQRKYKFVKEKEQIHLQGAVYLLKSIISMLLHLLQHLKRNKSL